MTADKFAKASEIVAQNTHLPVIADADTGFGGPLNIRRTI
jgi:2-methylisocitrate lyase-like PEP mutase family enzyme